MISRTTLRASSGRWSLLVLMMLWSLIVHTVSEALTRDMAPSSSPPMSQPREHRIGIFSTLTDNRTAAILETLTSDSIFLKTIDIVSSSLISLDGYRLAIQTLKRANVTALIGPFHSQYSLACQHLRLPYLLTSLLPSDQERNAFLIELFPDAQIFARSVLDVLTFYDYKKVAVIYDYRTGAIVLEKLLGEPYLEITALNLDHYNLQRAREAVKTMRDQYYVHFVVILAADSLTQVLDQALSLSMFASPYTWLLVNTGLHEYQLEKYVDSRANITVLRLMMDYNSLSCALQPEQINLKNAIVHDALNVYVRYAAQRDNIWNFSMRSANRQVEIDGCTGHLNFTSYGRRIEYFLQVMTLQGYRKGQSGTWRSAESLTLKERVVPSKTYSKVTRLGHSVFGYSPLRITTKIEPPFVHYRPNNKEWGEDWVPEAITKRPLEGLCIDILKELATMLNFQFNISLVPDDKFGSLKPSPIGWTGMVRELLDNRADLALAPFQMSTVRSKVVDFSKPFMTKGTTVVVKRPEQHLWIFKFLAPLSQLVWSAIFLSFVVVSLTLFGVSRVNSDRQAKYTQNFWESFWYIWGTLLRGSLNGSPRAISSRIVSSAWWFFCLIVTSIYTANLAAFLTITIGDAGIQTASDLARQDYYAYGTVEGSQTELFFKSTKMKDYAKMWAHMSTLAPDSIVRRVEDGFKRVREGGYAFIWDSPTIRHEISNDCDLMEIGSPFDNKGYGFALQKTVPFAERLSWALLKLNDDGVLYRLERKWWRPQVCPDLRRSATTESLNLETVAGMYLVLLAGIAISVTLSLLQYCLAKYRDRQKQKKRKDDDQGEKKLKAPIDVSSGDQDSPHSYKNRSPFHFRSYSAVNW